MFEHKNKVWYKGVFVISILMLALPGIFTLIFYKTMSISRINQTLEVSKYTSIFLGCVCGLLFDGTCILTGLFRGTFKVVILRIREFFLDLQVSFKFAVKNYFYDIKENGVMFWILLALIGSTVYFAIDSIQQLLILI